MSVRDTRGVLEAATPLHGNYLETGTSGQPAARLTACPDARPYRFTFY
jgi:hypothetical protein